MRYFFKFVFLYLFYFVLFLGLLVYNSSAYFFIFANSELNQINNQISEAKKKQQEILSEIKKLESNINKIITTEKNLRNQLKQLQDQKLIMIDRINVLENEIKMQSALIADYERKLEDKKLQIKLKMNYIYKLSFLNNSLNNILSSNTDIANFFIDRSQKFFLIDNYKNEIKQYLEQINYINTLKIENENNITSSQNSLKTIDSEIARVNYQLKENDFLLIDSNKKYSDLQLKADAIQIEIAGLSQKQKELLQAELNKIKTNTQVTQKSLQLGEYYFMGRGRDLVEGHGMGMSQWGAFGMANLGWSYERILNFYYPNTVIGDYLEPEKIFLSDCNGCESRFPEDARIRGYLTIDEYLAGLGEVPNNWPSEAIKAQIVAARTYLMGVCGNQRECTICKSDKCQVYLGGLGKLKWVEETKGKVILYDGKPIIAFYSASHRGCSSKRSDVWGLPDLPYIQNVRDDEFAFKGYYTSSPYNTSERIYPYNWIWRTNGYSLNTLTEIFNLDKRLAVGNVINITLQKDVCGRVSRITIVGEQRSVSLTGTDFRSIFNFITPYNDYLYSTEFGFYKYE